MAYLPIEIIDNIGAGYSPAWDDGFGWVLNLSCLAVWFGALAAAIGIALWRFRRLGYFLSLIAVSFASNAAYRYWAALDALQSVSLESVEGNFPEETNALPESWTSPNHDLRTQSTRDLNADGLDEILLVDRYHVPGSANEHIVHLQILRPTSLGFQLLFSQSVDEGRVYGFEVGCPSRPPRKLGYHSSIWVLNLDADASTELYLHQQTSHIPPNCWHDYFFDWKFDEVVGYKPSWSWLWLHALFPYALAIAVLGLDYLRKSFWFLVGAVVYVGWAAWETWVGSYSGIWLVASLALVGIILIFWQYRARQKT